VRERPYYKLREIEDICTEALRQVDLYPSTPEPVRIERFIEKRFGVHPEYGELPDGLLGYTKFGSQGVEEIVVSRALVEDGGQAAERQANSTLAHEAGHGLLQGHLFALEDDLTSFFGSDIDPAASKILCRNPRPQGARGYDGRWWEFQANQAIGALLLPRPLAVDTIRQLLNAGGVSGRQTLQPEKRGQAVKTLAETFDVNPAVARIRLEDMFPESEASQLSL
jgi:hypothetical protein